MGILMADRTADYYGWLQMYGINPGAIYTTASVGNGVEVIAAASAALKSGSSATENLWVGHAPDAISADLVTPFRAPVFMDVFHMAQPTDELA